MSNTPTLPEIIERARARGARIALDGASVTIYPPNKSTSPIHVGTRANRQRPNHLRNVISELRKAGLDVTEDLEEETPVPESATRPVPTPPPNGRPTFATPDQIAELKAGHETLMSMLAEAEQRDLARQRETTELRTQLDGLRSEVTKLRMQFVRLSQTVNPRAHQEDPGLAIDRGILELLRTTKLRMAANSIAANLTNADGGPLANGRQVGQRLVGLVKAGTVATNEGTGRERLYWATEQAESAGTPD